MKNEFHLTEAEAIKFFSDFYGGEHRIPGHTVKQCGYGWSVNHDRGELASWDFNSLTKLVIMAHDRCIRVSVDAIRNGILIIMIFKRERVPDTVLGHPTIETAIQSHRSHHPLKIEAA